MPRGTPNPKPEEVQVEKPEGVEETKALEVAEDSEQPVEFVTAKEFQEVNQWFVEQLADLSQRVSDMELLAAQPVGSVRFLDIETPGADDVPEYTPEHGGPGWYQPRG